MQETGRGATVRRAGGQDGDLKEHGDSDPIIERTPANAAEAESGNECFLIDQFADELRVEREVP